jgi:hypothetical protein
MTTDLQATTAVTQRNVRRSRRTWFNASFNHACVLYLQMYGWSGPPGLVEELEIKARLERAAFDELRILAAERET